MKYLVKLLSYLKYTLIPPFAGLLLWFSLRLTQGLFNYMVAFINERQFVATKMVGTIDPYTGEIGQDVTLLEWFNDNLYTVVSFVLKLAYYLGKWIPVEFIIWWSCFIITTALIMVIARITLKIITFGQF